MEKTIIFLLAFISVLYIPASASAGNNAYGIFREGLQLENSLKYFEAMDKYRKAIAEEPDNAGYMEHYAWFLSANGFSEEAAELFKMALPFSSNKEILYRGLGWNEKLAGCFSESLNAYGKAFHIIYAGKNYKASFKDITSILSAENEVKKEKLTAELKQDPRNDNILQGLYDACISDGDLKDAIRFGILMVANNPENLRIRFKLAKTYQWMGEKDLSESEMKKLLAISPENPFLYYELGKVQHAHGRLAEAKASLEHSLAVYPHAADTKKELTEVLAELGKGEEAVSLATSIRDRKGERLIAQLAVARAYHFSGKIREAASFYRQILRQYPNNDDALWGLVETSLLGGGVKEAESTLEQWQRNGDDPRIYKQKKLLSFYTSPHVGLQGDYYSNSADFSRYNLGTFCKLYYGGSIFDIGYHFSSFSQTRFSSITRNSVSVETERRLAEKLLAVGKIGGNFYENNQNHLNGKLSLYFEPAQEFVLGLNYEHVDIIDTEPAFKNAIYNYVVTIGSVGRKITTNDASLYAHGSLVPRLDLWGKILYGFLSDGNTKSSYTFGADYSIFQIPMLILGYNYFFLDYRRPAPNYREGTENISAYYDPFNFEVHTVRLEYRQRLGDTFGYGFEGRLSYIPKSDGIANSVFAHAAYKWGERQSIRLDARQFYQNRGVDRNGVSGHFRAENVVLSYEYIF
jgi:tetratricopeptide (TPR) repeat protein